MVAARQSKEVLRLDESIVGLSIGYDGSERVGAPAHQSVVEESYRKGYDEASSQYNQQILDFRSEVNDLREGTFSALEERFSSILKEARDALVTLTHECVVRTIGGLDIGSEIILSIVNSVIEESGLDEERMEIRLNPKDLDFLVEFEAELKSKHPRLEFSSDESLNRGDCILSSRFGKVDGLLSTKMNRLKDGLAPR
jgi:flagellar biosynthesis/type III secretory pathway protein FliH